MKILHTADWHLGKRLDPFSRLPEQAEVLDEICQIAEAEAVDAVLIAGDLYDVPNPPIEARRLLYRTLHRLADNGRRPVIGIAGNHDSPDGVESVDPLAREVGILLMGHPRSRLEPYTLENGLALTRSDAGFIELKLPGQAAPLRLLLTPYANELRLRKAFQTEDEAAELRALLQDHWRYLAEQYCDEAGVNVLMTHLFVAGSKQEVEALREMEDEEEKSVLSVGGAQQFFPEDFPAGLQYVALGHLHGYIEVQKNPYPLVYSSSPLVYSVSDRQKQKQVVIVEAEPGHPAQWRKVPLTKGRPALQQRFGSMPEALAWLEANPHTWVECTIATREHLTAEDRRALAAAHDGILRVIPEFSDPDMLRFTSGRQIDLSRGIDELFRDYFQHRKGTEPNAELMELFREVVSEAEEE